MKRVCAWCGTELGETESTGTPTHPITHGICESCSIELWGESGTPLEDFLASLEIPTLLVDGPGVVEKANESALEMLGKSVEGVGGKFGGEAFDCVNADLPAGSPPVWTRGERSLELSGRGSGEKAQAPSR